MLKIRGIILKNNKIVIEHLLPLKNIENYQDSLNECILEICKEFDIAKPYWLPSNVDEYNKRRKTIFNKDNFIEEINFDKFILEEIEIEEI